MERLEKNDTLFYFSDGRYITIRRKFSQLFGVEVLELTSHEGATTAFDSEFILSWLADNVQMSLSDDLVILTAFAPNYHMTEEEYDKFKLTLFEVADGIGG